MQLRNVIIWGGGGTVLIHHTFMKTPAAPWDVINVLSLNPLEGDFLLIYKSTFRSHRRKRTTNQRRLKDQKPKTEILEITTTSLR